MKPIKLIPPPPLAYLEYALALLEFLPADTVGDKCFIIKYSFSNNKMINLSPAIADSFT